MPLERHCRCRRSSHDGHPSAAGRCGALLRRTKLPNPPAISTRPKFGRANTGLLADDADAHRMAPVVSCTPQVTLGQRRGLRLSDLASS